MTFNTALSGLRAASTDLEVTGNNIANASTIGFKKARAEFGDVYANSLIGSGSNQAGSGVLVTNIAQQYGQGNISFTDNALDLAINGAGFFILQEASGARAYTRAGYFGLDASGNIVNNLGSQLLGFLPSSTGVISGGQPQPLQIQTSAIPPQPTSTASVTLNLDARETVPAVAPFDPNDADTFNDSTSMTVYDSRGISHTMNNYFVNTGLNTWAMHTYIDGVDVVTGPATAVTFATDGTLVSPATVTIDDWNPVGAAASPVSDFVLNIGTSTQFGSAFAVSAIDQDGYATGQLAGVEVDDSGTIFARYTNGEALTLGRVALASFANVQGLSPQGDTTWAESFESGQPVEGEPLTGSLGAIQSGSLEESNVDLSEELVRLIIAQRNFQANAKTIETADTVTQAIINIR